VTLRSVLKVAEKYVIENSPTIISAFAVTGAAATAYLTGKATFKAAKIIAEEQANQDLQELGHSLDTKEKVKLVWKEYIPPALCLTGTVVAIITANSISASRLAALAAAYKISEKQFDEYRDKVLEKLGLNKEQELRDEINTEYAEQHPLRVETISNSFLNGNDVWFLEKYTGRYFRSDMESLRAAENRMNKDVFNNMYATLSDFYEEIGLEPTQVSSEVGWNIDNPVELYFTTTFASDGRTPVAVMEYRRLPKLIKDYHRGFGGTH
jgi:hypothetical protein